MLKSLLGIARQWSHEERSILILEPRSHVEHGLLTVITAYSKWLRLTVIVKHKLQLLEQNRASVSVLSLNKFNILRSLVHCSTFCDKQNVELCVTGVKVL